MTDQSGFAEPIKEGLPDQELERLLEEEKAIKSAERRKDFAESVLQYIKTHESYEEWNKETTAKEVVSIMLQDIGLAQEFLNVIGLDIDLYSTRLDETDGQLVRHARQELARIETDPWMIEGIVKVIKTFAEMGHCGGTATWAIPVITDLLQFKNLTPLTNDPDEWMLVGPDVWQSTRNSEAFSTDGGVTHYLLSETKVQAPHPKELK